MYALTNMVVIYVGSFLPRSAFPELEKPNYKFRKKLDFLKKYDPKEAIKFLKDNSHVKFNETLDVAIKLSIDASKTDQSISTFNSRGNIFSNST